jgi:hypothetical protein
MIATVPSRLPGAGAFGAAPLHAVIDHRPALERDVDGSWHGAPWWSRSAEQ